MARIQNMEVTCDLEEFVDTNTVQEAIEAGAAMEIDMVDLLPDGRIAVGVRPFKLQLSDRERIDVLCDLLGVSYEDIDFDQVVIQRDFDGFGRSQTVTLLGRNKQGI